MTPKDPKNKKQTRTNRNQTERKQTPKWQFAIIGLLVLVLLFLLVKIFSDGANKTPDNLQFPTDATTEISETSESASKEESEDTASDAASEEAADSDSEEDQNNEENEEDVALEEAEPSDDLVKEAYTGDWAPVGTTQEGAHENTNYTDGSQDRIEIKRASAVATGLSEETMIEWWVGNDGPNRVVTTVSDPNETKIFRVYMEWVNGEGWKPTKVEKLKENDKNN